MCSTNIWKYLPVKRVFHEKKCIRNFRLKQKVIFSYTIEYLAFGFSMFAENLPTQ